MPSLKSLFISSFEYFFSSIKSFSTWVLIVFNLFILYEFIKRDITPGNVVFLYIIQISIYLVFFGVTILFLNKFKSLGKDYSGKGIKTGLFIFTISIWIFYGIAISILTYSALNFTRNIGINFFIGLLLFSLSYIINFVWNFSIEKERLEKTDLVKFFFEPAGNLFPVYLSTMLLSMFKGEAGVIIIIFKTLADIIINSPLNAENPFIFQILGGNERLKQS